MATAMILAAVLGYCGFLVYRALKNRKEGKHSGCSCGGSCSSCGYGCSCAVGKTENTVKKR